MAQWSFGKFGSLNRHTLHLAKRWGQAKKIYVMKKYYSKRTPKAQITKLLIISIVFSAIFYWLQMDMESISIYLIIVWTLMLILTGYGIIHAAKNKPTLIVNKEGIIDSSSLNAIGTLDWDEIKNIEIRKGVNMNFLCFDLENEKAVLQRISSIKKILAKSNKKQLGTICAIPEISLNQSLESVFEAINLYRQTD
ncbi:STM3941 family protein [Carboxylicivirga marina]|uniref:STM3941 family protein n=1 Tax=Carboxylicivirga marina TaxID=2800988 RepID=UPI00259ADBA5|nr:STM3941 family protein [uncultured Carboxylicivirga sp.]